ncbi:heme lyase CcmF/NrfE family subunit [Mesorhizobium sp. RP14(2022)]|uniref:Heme lyase CcmF/NrfE family subunit n=1 Tax=Mesorhizobium liriopis TaxID=2953882 RepID=A0ABT1C2C8_9HYPH|nr:heme lyase CcmF/NrfE family subunit [Mesorhizobium liriopis]MCO6048653.1 heme lyase CcmF/NrfE family subunit [Mesorhizobium liriopis]
MSVEAGHFALVLAFALALIQSTVPLLGTRWNDRRMMAASGPVAITGFVLTLIAFAALTLAYAQSDFSLQNVYENSHSLKPMIFKLSGVWGNHEGSMLLWVLILTLFGAAVAAFGENLPPSLKANVLAVQGMIGAAFFLFILVTSNPFARLDPAPIEGQDLNPVLQDIGLAIHPPLLYLGYVGFSVCFSFAVAALIEGRIDAAWARWVRPWTLAAWVFLTGGIAMGSYWAYYELGWGGFWFWDPVENASFMPWLAGTALLHSALVMEKRSALKVWTILLAILTFSLSLLGTFLVRSGVLTSVHAFATDPTRGVFILGILSVFVGGSLALFAFRASALTTGGLFHPISREGSLVLNNLFLTTATATVLIGTLYPLALEAVTGTKISVGAPFFNLTFGLIIFPLLLLVPFGTMLAWKRGDALAAAQRLLGAAALALGAMLVTGLVSEPRSIFAVVGIGIGVWLLAGVATDLALRAGLPRAGFGTALHRVAGLPRSAIGTMLAHAGLGVTVLGLVGALAFGREAVVAVKPGEQVAVGAYTMRFEGLSSEPGPNFSSRIARFSLLDAAGSPHATIASAKRFYPVRRMPTTEAGIRTMWLGQLYVSIGEERADGALVVHAWWKPLVTLIWGGALLMMAGGTLSLLDRRLRVGAPSRRARPVAAPVPAE